MQWNVELERGLRSNKPGAHLEAIMKMGPRLQRRSEEPVVTALTASLFKLDSGQDRAFVNSILLCLADAFRTGNNFTRLCIEKALILEFKSRRCSERDGYKGILTKERMPKESLDPSSKMCVAGFWRSHNFMSPGFEYSSLSFAVWYLVCSH